MSLENLKAGIASLVFISLIIAAMVIALDSFQSGLTGAQTCSVSNETYNVTSGACQQQNTTNAAQGSTTVTFNITQSGLEGASNATTYLGTIGTLLGVAALVAVVIGAFYFATK